MSISETMKCLEAANKLLPDNPLEAKKKVQEAIEWLSYDPDAYEEDLINSVGV